MSKPISKLKSFITAEEVSLSDVKEVFSGTFSGIWAKRKKLLIVILLPVLLFWIIGAIAAYTSPKEYEAKCVLLSDQASSGGGGSGLAGLANLAGLIPGGGAGGSTSADGADIYPLILGNKPFLIDLARQPIYLPDTKKTITLEQYFAIEPKTDLITKIRKGVVDLPSILKDWIKSSKPETNINSIAIVPGRDTSSVNMENQSFSNSALVSDLNSGDAKMIALLNLRIKLTQTGKLATLSVKMPEARLSAEATKTVLNLLIKYAIRFKLSKQLETVHFLEERTAEADRTYKANQQRVAGFKDNNYGVIYESIQSKEQQLQNEFSLSFALYNQLVTQLQQARIELKKETPLFTVLEPVYIPRAPSAADSKQVIISYIMMGLVIGIIIALFIIVRPLFRSN